MRCLRFFATCLCLGACAVCFSKGGHPPFNALVIQEEGSCLGMHERDAWNMKGTLETIAKCVGGPRHVTCVGARHFSMAKFKKWCGKLPHKSIAVVYYSGKDAHEPCYEGVWPLAQFGMSKVPIDELAEELHANGARLSVVFADCYDKFIQTDALEKRRYGKLLAPIKQKKFQRRVKHEWTSVNGKLLLCSSEHGAYSRGVWAGAPECYWLRYGAFTEALLTVLSFGTSMSGPERKVRPLANVPASVAFQLAHYGPGRGNQHPICRVRIVRR